MERVITWLVLWVVDEVEAGLSVMEWICDGRVDGGGEIVGGSCCEIGERGG